MRPALRLLLLLAVLLLGACEKPFEALAPSELAFSIYGHLDSAADTQWVRVMPIRASAETFPGPIDAVVTLEELETGARVTLSDSLLRYAPSTGEGLYYAHNFSTTMRLVPGRHYRLTATRSDGATSSATVLIPTFQNPTLQLLYRPGTIPAGYIQGTRYLAMVLSRQDIPASCNWPFPIHQEFLPVRQPAMSEGDAHQVQMGWPPPPGPRPSYVPPPPQTCPPGTSLGPRRILTIAASEPWPYGPTADLRSVTHPATVGNVDRGTGFLAGVQTYVFPFAECAPAQGASTCTVTIGPRAATLVGLVTNACDGLPLAGIRARLEGPRTPGIRTANTDSAGALTIYGVEPREPHSLTLSDQTTPSRFIPVELNNLIFGEGRVDTLTIEMQGNCGSS